MEMESYHWQKLIEQLFFGILNSALIVRQCFVHLKLPIPMEYVRMIWYLFLSNFSSIDTQSGFVEFKEFHHLLELLYHYNELSQLFGQLDTNRDKRISFVEFKKGHELIGHSHVNENQLKEDFNRIDTNRGGYILFDEVSFFFHWFFFFTSSFILVLYIHGKEEITLKSFFK